MEKNETTFLHTVIFPKAKAYPVSEVLDFLALVKFPCTHHSNDNKLPARIWVPHQSTRENDINLTATGENETKEKQVIALSHNQKATLDGDVENDNSDCPNFINLHNPCPRCVYLRNEARQNLATRLAKMVREEKIELWDTYLTVVREPPQTGDMTCWPAVTSIFKDDLVAFCNKERLAVNFDAERSNETGSMDHSNAITDTSQSPQSGNDEPVNEQTVVIGLVKETLPSTSANPQGKLPRTGARKLAIKAAMFIEIEKKRIATGGEVIDLLQDWFDQGMEGTLVGKTASGVKWKTGRGKIKDFDVEACQKALNEWNDSRR